MLPSTIGHTLTLFLFPIYSPSPTASSFWCNRVCCFHLLYPFLTYSWTSTPTLWNFQIFNISLVHIKLGEPFLCEFLSFFLYKSLSYIVCTKYLLLRIDCFYISVQLIMILFRHLLRIGYMRFILFLWTLFLIWLLTFWFLIITLFLIWHH